MITDQLVFWSAVEAIGTVIAAIAAFTAVFLIIFEYRRIQRESLSHKIRGYEIARGILDKDPFLSAAKSIQEDPGPGVTYDNWFSYYPKLLFELLRGAEVLQFLIKEKHLDEEFLFRLEGFRLGELDQRISAVEQSRKSPRLLFWAELYPDGRELLRKARTWVKDIAKYQFLLDPDNPARIW